MDQKNDPIQFVLRIYSMITEYPQKNPAMTAAMPVRLHVAIALKNTMAHLHNGANIWIVDKMVEKIRDEATLHLITVRDERDEGAFRELYRILSPKILGYLIKRGMARDGAEEVIQETFVTIWQKTEQFDPSRANAAAWVFQIARNKMIDRFRGEARPLPTEIDITVANHEPDAEHILGLQSDIEALEIALSQLSSDQRDIIEKAFLGEMTHSEINKLTGLPLGTIKSRVRLGLEKLRYELSKT